MGGGVEKSPFKTVKTVRNRPYVSIGSWYEYMSEQPNVPIPVIDVLQIKELQIGDHRLSTSYGVVERPDHHCGDYNEVFSAKIDTHVIH